MPRRLFAAVRLAVQELEGRAVPANTITVTNDPAPVNIRVTDRPGELVIDTTGPGARINLATLEAALRHGPGFVRISSDADTPDHDGHEAGSIVWPAGIGGPDLTGLRATKLTVGTTPQVGAVGDIDLTGVTFDGPEPGRLDLVLSAGPAGAVRLHDDGAAGVRFGRAIDDLQITAGTGGVMIEAAGGSPGIDVSASVVLRGGSIAVPAGALISAGGSVTLGSPAITLGGSVEARDGGAVMTGAVTLTAPTTVRAGGAAFDGPIDGPFGLTVSGGRLAFGADIGAVTPLDSLTIETGEARFDGDRLSAGTVRVGGGPGKAIAGPAGTLTGDVVVAAGGVLSPAGLDQFGQLIVEGDVAFDGGTYAPDLNGDMLRASGDVTLANGARLGAGYGMGSQDFPRKALDWGGTLTGTFANAPPGTPVVVGADAVRVTAYGPAGTGIVLAQIPAGPNRVSGEDADGTGYRAELTGGGRLVTGTDAAGRRFLVVRDSGPGTTLSVTVRAAGADGNATFDGGVVVDGPLARLSAPAVAVADQFRVTGRAGTIRVLRLTDTGGVGARFGLRTRETADGVVALSAGDVSMDVWVGGRLRALTLTGDLTGELAAFGHGAVRANDITGRIDIPLTLPSGSVTAAGTFSGAYKADGSLVTFRAAEVGPAATIRAYRLGAMTVTGTFSGTVTAHKLPLFSAGSVSGGLVAGAEVGRVSAGGAYNGTVTADSLKSFAAAGGSATLAVSPSGSLGSVRVSGPEAALTVTAGDVGSIRIAGTLRGLAPWEIVGHVGRLTAGAVAGLDLTAASLGQVSVTGRVRFEVAGEVRDSTFTTTGGGRLLGLASLSVADGVWDSRFDVRRGNAGPVTVGRFIRSDMFVNYEPDGGFTQLWGNLARFVTTAPRSPAGPGEWAYEDSRIAAAIIGPVRLSGLRTENGGRGFGITTVVPGSVRVSAADVNDDPDLPFKQDLTPSSVALAGDFFYRAS